VGTTEAGVARFDGGAWRYYTAASGLPDDTITSIFVDRASTPRRVIVGTASGVAVYAGP
jgi:hypothetical protein